MSTTAEPSSTTALFTALNKAMEALHQYDKDNGTRRLTFINDWCRTNYKQTIPILINNADVPIEEKQAIIVHIHNAVEKDDWSAFEEAIGEEDHGQPQEQPVPEEEEAAPVQSVDPTCEEQGEPETEAEPKEKESESPSEDQPADTAPGSIEALKAQLWRALDEDADLRGKVAELVRAQLKEKHAKQELDRMSRWRDTISIAGDLIYDYIQLGKGIEPLKAATTNDPVLSRLIEVLNEEVQ